MKGKPGNKARLEHILTAIKEIEFYTKGLDRTEFLKNSMVRFASVKQIEIIGEAVVHISKATKEKYPQIAWSHIETMRHILVHEYYGMDFKVVWQSIKEDIPGLKTEIEKINKEV